MTSRVERFGAVLFDFGGVLIPPITDKVHKVAERAVCSPKAGFGFTAKRCD